MHGKVIHYGLKSSLFAHYTMVVVVVLLLFWVDFLFNLILHVGLRLFVQQCPVNYNNKNSVKYVHLLPEMCQTFFQGRRGTAPLLISQVSSCKDFTRMSFWHVEEEHDWLDGCSQ